MRIALLNLPIDNNYGGNLQRYALMKVLQDMGHDVTHISLFYRAKLRWYIVPFAYMKRFVYKYILRRSIVINQEAWINQLYNKKWNIVKPFYSKHIKHTQPCYNVKDILRVIVGKYDAFIVGSDQCWRKDMTKSIGWNNFMFDFVKNSETKLIAYGVSFGKDVNMYKGSEFSEFKSLYEKFYAVSVRENTALNILDEMGCYNPVPVQVLDPTLLLPPADYIKLFSDINLDSPSRGKVLCYVLDKTEEIINFAYKKAIGLNTEAVFYGISDDKGLSIEMWLKSIYEASFVITDSYHGTIFSILFNKPFKFCGNEKRGNARISSLFETLGISDEFDYGEVNNKIELWRGLSKEFLQKSIN